MPGMGPGMVPLLQASAPHQRWGVWPLRMIWREAGPVHGGSSVGLGFEPGVLWPQGRGLTTRPRRLLDMLEQVGLEPPPADSGNLGKIVSRANHMSLGQIDLTFSLHG
ncbi:hypothetical protein AVEN_999-1 [Araneus ventricosus]|uniref:Uncharacterized protein n=1 Tax=Araneus ventricosus TaxID=182803 RepID=A0A4Y2CXJ0_ARAVE|nr:hypothetical protein AVEN_999-1 [Araneus ventricosus]